MTISKRAGPLLHSYLSSLAVSCRRGELRQLSVLGERKFSIIKINQCSTAEAIPSSGVQFLKTASNKDKRRLVLNSNFRIMATAQSDQNTGVGNGHDRSKCIFCKIVDGKENNEIFYQDAEIVVFQDIRPAAKHHLLIVPREHIRDCKSLVASQLGLLDRLIQVGNQVLAERIKQETPAADLEQTQKLLGFHWPPFHSVSHLHLHVIAPSTEVGFLGRAIFRPNSFWFVTSDYVRERLEKMASENNSNTE